MENPTKTNDVDHDLRLHSLRRMGFESWTRVDNTAGRTNIRDNWGYDRLIRHMDERREVRTQKNGEGRTMRKYFKRLWCALWNKKCHDDCDCV